MQDALFLAANIGIFCSCIFVSVYYDVEEPIVSGLHLLVRLVQNNDAKMLSVWAEQQENYQVDKRTRHFSLRFIALLEITGQLFYIGRVISVKRKEKKYK